MTQLLEISTAPLAIQPEADTREAWLNAYIDASRPVFEALGTPIPLNIRASIGFTSHGYKASRVAEVWFPAASADGHYEIFVNPTTQTDSRIADLVCHEIVHAAVHAATGHGGHGKEFKALATSVGLEGPMRSTYAGEAWYKWNAPILEALGAMPYGAIKGDSVPPTKKQRTYLLKIECPDCGWTARATAKHIHEGMTCPVPDCGSTLWVDGSNDDPQ